MKRSKWNRQPSNPYQSADQSGCIRPFGSNGKQIDNGSFSVYSDNPASTRQINWVVEEVRKDIVPLEKEPLK